MTGHKYEGAAKQIGFIVGTGRCGTTILGEVLNAHSRICVPHELQIIVSIGNGDRLYEKYTTKELSKYRAKDFIKLIGRSCPYYFEKFFDYHGHFQDLDYPQTDLRQLLTGLFGHICQAYGKEVFLEQTPWYGQKLEVLRELFPEMKIIHLIRDGRDVAISYARTPWWSRDINKNLKQWEREVNKIHDYGRQNPANFLEIRYEDLVLNPEPELKKILALFDLEYQKAMLDPQNLIDYTRLFKRRFFLKRSMRILNRQVGKTNVFLPENVYAWKRQSGLHFNLTPEISRTMTIFNYEIGS